MEIEKETQRILTLLRNKIRERGFTQLEVQEKLDWGRSYISQLLTRQKSLRVEQVLMILDVIGVEPTEFYAELYHLPLVGRGVPNLDEYPDPPRSPGPKKRKRRVRAKPRATFRDRGRPLKASGGESEAGDGSEVRQMQAFMRALVDVLVDSEVASRDDIVAAAQEVDEEVDLDFLN